MAAYYTPQGYARQTAPSGGGGIRTHEGPEGP